MSTLEPTIVPSHLPSHFDVANPKVVGMLQPQDFAERVEIDIYLRPYASTSVPGSVLKPRRDPATGELFDFDRPYRCVVMKADLRHIDAKVEPDMAAFEAITSAFWTACREEVMATVKSTGKTGVTIDMLTPPAVVGVQPNAHVRAHWPETTHNIYFRWVTEMTHETERSPEARFRHLHRRTVKPILRYEIVREVDPIKRPEQATSDQTAEAMARALVRAGFGGAGPSPDVTAALAKMQERLDGLEAENTRLRKNAAKQEK